MPNKTSLENVVSIDVCYDYVRKLPSGKTLETNTVRVYFSNNESAEKFKTELPNNLNKDYSLDVAGPVSKEKEERTLYYIQLKIEAYYTWKGRRGRNTIHCLHDYFNNLPETITVSRYDEKAPGQVVENITSLMFSECELLYYPLPKFLSLIELRHSGLLTQFSVICGSPVVATPLKTLDHPTDMFSEILLSCVDAQAAKTLRFKLFELADDIDSYDQISFRPDSDHARPLDKSAFVLFLKRGLILQDLLQYQHPSPAAASSSEGNKHSPVFFSAAPLVTSTLTKGENPAKRQRSC